MVTISDVARRAGVSTATVSRVLNGLPGQASAETQQRVRAVARELQYVPNSIGRNLRRQDSRSWTLLLPTIENPFVTQLSRGIEDVAQASGYGVLMGNTYDDPEKERAYLREAEMSRASGVLLTPTSDDVAIDTLLDLGVPVVSILRPLPTKSPGGADRKLDIVLNDTAETSRRGTQSLIERGCRRIACLPGLYEDHTDRLRYEGYRQAHDDNGLSVDRSLVHFSSISEDLPPEVTRRLLQRNADAILVANSLTALGVIGSLKSLGLDLDHGPALFSCDSASWMPILAPQMSAARQPAYEFGIRAANLLLDRLENPSTEPRITVLESTIHSPVGHRTAGW